MKIHPLALEFPPLSEEEMALLAQDIKEHGQREPIWTFEEQIIEGVQRKTSCEIAGVEPKYREYKGGDLESFVISYNIRRRHLNAGQRAMIEANVRNINPTPPGAHRTQFEEVSGAAKEAQVSARTIQKAARVRARDKKLAKEVVQGKTSLNKAVKQVAAKDAQKKVQAKASKKRKKRTQEPKQVKSFLDSIGAWFKAVTRAIETAEDGLFSPEGARFALKNIGQAQDRVNKLTALLEALGGENDKVE